MSKDKEASDDAIKRKAKARLTSTAASSSGSALFPFNQDHVSLDSLEPSLLALSGESVAPGESSANTAAAAAAPMPKSTAKQKRDITKKKKSSTATTPGVVPVRKTGRGLRSKGGSASNRSRTPATNNTNSGEFSQDYAAGRRRTTGRGLRSRGSSQSTPLSASYPVKEKRYEKDKSSDHFNAEISTLFQDELQARPSQNENQSLDVLSQPTKLPDVSTDSFRDEDVDSNVYAHDSDDQDAPRSGFLVEATLVDELAGGSNNMTAEEREQFEQDTRKRMMEEMVIDAETAVIVEPDVNDPKRAQQKRRRRLCFCVLGSLLLLAVILGSVLGTASKRDSTPKFIVVTPGPTFSTAPSANPTWRPTSSSRPSDFPSVSPSLVPTEMPTSSSRPSEFPSITPSTIPTNTPTSEPDNNFCDEAMGVSVGDTVFVEDLYAVDTFIPTPPDTESPAPIPDAFEKALAPGSAPLYTKINDDQLSFPALFLEDRQFDDEFGPVYQVVNVNCAGGVAFSAPGRWYKFNGIGPVTATTCDDQTTVDMSIQVYVDSGDCETQLTCASDLTYQPFFESDCVKVTWPAVAGVEYLILALEAPEIQSWGGSYALSISNNDKCPESYGPLSAGESVSGSFNNAEVDIGLPACGRASAPNQPGVWYHIEGTGGLLKVDTCTNTATDTQISVFRSTNSSSPCSNLTCVDGNDNGCGAQSLVSWASEPGETYHILVHGGSATFSGNFFFKVEAEGSGILPNDFCHSPQEIEFGLMEDELNFTVALTSATEDPEIYETNGWCLGIGNDLDRLGVWYSFAGTGQSIEVSVSSQDSDPRVTIFTGACESLECDTGEQMTTSTTFSSVLGETYLLYVHYHRPQQVEVSNVLVTVRATL